MPPELRTVRQRNDIAVMEAYGFDVQTIDESGCATALTQTYQELAKFWKQV